MRIVVKGFAYRTSGRFAPFDEFEKAFDASSLAGEVALPLQECAFAFKGGEVLFRFGEERQTLPLEKGETKTAKAQRNVLGVEVSFTLIE